MGNLIPIVKPGQPVGCTSCDHKFKQDPIFEVSCPVCKAKVGSYCKRPSEHSGPFVSFHRDRDLKALKEGCYDHNGNVLCGPNSDSERVKEILRKYV